MNTPYTASLNSIPSDKTAATGAQLHGHQMHTDYDVVVIGAGPAGLAAALSAREQGCGRILVLERDVEPGGILNQCIHSGFGLHYFGETLTGPEYAERFIEKIKEAHLTVQTDTMVLSVEPDLSRPPAGTGRTSHTVVCVSSGNGLQRITTTAVILATGCRERPRGAIALPGSRPAGIFTAGTAQRYVNLTGYLPGKRIVILGSGDIGLIMARRLTLEGAEVLACIELNPYPGGLQRNIVQCLEDFNIPLYLNHTITNITGIHRVQQVTATKVDTMRNPIPGTEINFDCDTLLLSVGLIPENELAQQAGIQIDTKTGGAAVYDNMETSVPGIFACGNALHVHDLVDYVSAEGTRAGAAAAEFCRKTGHGCAKPAATGSVALCAGPGVTGIVPQYIRYPEPAEISGDSSCGTETGPRNSLNPSGNDGITGIRQEHPDTPGPEPITGTPAPSRTFPANTPAGTKQNGNNTFEVQKNCDDSIAVSFRVTEPVGKCCVTITDSGGTAVAEFPKRRLVPGETVRIRLPRNLFSRQQLQPGSSDPAAVPPFARQTETDWHLAGICRMPDHEEQYLTISVTGPLGETII